MQLAPSASLSHIVKHYLVLESENEIQLTYRLFSDGNPGIVFHYKNPLIQFADDQLTSNKQPNSFIYGQITHYNNLMSAGKLGMLVVVLQPYAIYSLLHTAACELNNSIIKLTDLFGQEASELEEELLNTQKWDLLIKTVERFLLKKAQYINNPDPILIESLHLIYSYRGLITMEELLKKLPVSERQLERKFKEHIGITPKKFSDIIKFQSFLKLLQNHPPGRKISDVIYDGGYYDPSHLNSYFKKTTGVTPWQYRLDHPRLASNFIQLSANA